MLEFWVLRDDNGEELQVEVEVLNIQRQSKGVVLYLEQGAGLAKLDMPTAKLMARAVLEDQQFFRLIAGAMKSAVDAHGPIDTNLVPSATKRVHGQLLAALKGD